MPALTQFLPHLLQFTPQPLLDRLPPHREPVALLGFPAYVREAKKIEGLGFAFPSTLPVTFDFLPLEIQLLTTLATAVPAPPVRYKVSIRR